MQYDLFKWERDSGGRYIYYVPASDGEYWRVWF